LKDSPRVLVLRGSQDARYYAKPRVRVFRRQVPGPRCPVPATWHLIPDTRIGFAPRTEHRAPKTEPGHRKTRTPGMLLCDASPFVSPWRMTPRAGPFLSFLRPGGPPEHSAGGIPTVGRGRRVFHRVFPGKRSWRHRGSGWPDRRARMASMAAAAPERVVMQGTLHRWAVWRTTGSSA
jgi:hypothetical protein